MIERNTTSKFVPTEVGNPLTHRGLNERFRIVEVLGSGRMGRVYKAIQAPLNRLVVLKVVNARYASGMDPGFQERFFREASVASKLRHPNTATVLDYGKTDDGIFFIAMECLEGKTLAQLLTRLGPQPWSRALSMGMQIARSLREAHKLGLIHRNLKPANVMVVHREEGDLIKVLDFGLVKGFTPEPEASTPSDVELTQAGVILGSPQYMAPEQARNISDPRSDVYSLGVLLYQTLTGRPPFQGAQSIDVIIKHLNEPPPPFSAVLPTHTVPPEVEALVMRCLAKQPDGRFQTMDEVLERMKRVSTGASISGTFNTIPPRLGSGPRQLSTGGLPPSGTAAAHPGQAGAQRRQQAADAQATGASTVDFDVSLEDEAPRKKLLALALLGCAALVGLGAVALLLRSPEPAPTAPVQQPAPGAASSRQVAPVRFLVASEPSGARVLYRGKSLGETPVQLEVAPDARGRAEADLTFVLPGYERVESTAAGRGPTVRFIQRLKKSAGAGREPGSPDSREVPLP